MKHVRQKHSHDCGIAALATFCGIRYSLAKRAFPQDIRQRHNFSVQEMMGAAQKLPSGVVAWGKQYAGKTVAELPIGETGETILCLVCPRGGMHGHWIVVTCDYPGMRTVSDPCYPTAVDMMQYRKRNWLVIRTAIKKNAKCWPDQEVSECEPVEVSQAGVS